MSGERQLPAAQSVRWRAVRRAMLWVLLFVLVAATVAAAVREWSEAPPPEPAEIPLTTQPEWASTATEFARRYLSWTGSPEAWSERVGQIYRGPELDYPETSSITEVTSAQMIYLQSIGEGRALVTVQATVRNTDKKRTYQRVLVVPVLRPEPGSAAVYDLPSVAPALKVPEEAESEPQAELPEEEVAPLESTVTRFVSAYLAGEDFSLAVDPERAASVLPQAAPMKVLNIDAPEPLDVPVEPGHVVVAVPVRATDLDLNRDVRLRLLIELVKRDRWLVVRVLG